MKPQVTVGLGARKKKMKKKLRMRERTRRRRRSTVAGELARQDKPIHSPKWVPMCKCWWAVSFGVVCVSWFVDLVCCWLSILWPLYLLVQLVPHGSWLFGWIGWFGRWPHNDLVVIPLVSHTMVENPGMLCFDVVLLSLLWLVWLTSVTFFEWIGRMFV